LSPVFPFSFSFSFSFSFFITLMPFLMIISTFTCTLIVPVTRMPLLMAALAGLDAPGPEIAPG
jgi:hypothetical protein